MDWEPNVDAVGVFLREIWPTYWPRWPNCALPHCGPESSGRVRRLAGSSVEVTGRVPSVVDHLREAAVVVVPLRIGGGTRLKIYEAMAMGRAVVSTTVGAEGLEVHHGRDILLCDAADNFAESVATTMQDAAARDRLESAAAELASNYGWPLIGARFGKILETVKKESVELVRAMRNK